ncbi:PHD and RING finger domain-containing protein 1 [Nephila pilipes]|uniref:PHD and RING finger domain-containing protein 1 n=1 Tax=Nephila pilipes TaxID=299642 RepID=A0A8X6PAM1_NEPPI|nr:PHD and RING finger domain-containing protein 1 [Nephila pilipes]
MDGNDNCCPICFEPLKDKRTAFLDICDHVYCFSCLDKWLKIESCCPIDRKKIREIISSGEIINVKPRKRRRSQALYDISVHCEICKDSKDKNNDTVVLCDSCDLAYHLVCLDPPLKQAPIGNWYCSDCEEVTRRLKSKAKKANYKIKMESNDTIVESRAGTTSKSFVGTQNEQINSAVVNINKEVSVEEHFDNAKKCSSFHHAENSNNRTKNNSFVIKKRYVSNCFTDVSSDDSEDFFSMHGDNVILTTKQKFWKKEGNFSCDMEAPKKTESANLNLNSCNEQKYDSCMKTNDISNSKKKSPTLEKLEHFFSIYEDNIILTNRNCNNNTKKISSKNTKQNSSKHTKTIDPTLTRSILKSCLERNIGRRSEQLTFSKKLAEDISDKNEMNNSKQFMSEEYSVNLKRKYSAMCESNEVEENMASLQLSASEKLDDSSVTIQKYLNVNEPVDYHNNLKSLILPCTNLGDLNHSETFESTQGKYISSVKQTSSREVLVDYNKDFQENSLDNFNIQEVNYSIKAKKNSPTELMKIEQEKLNTPHIKSEKYKCNSSSSRNDLNTSFYSASPNLNNLTFTEKKKQDKMEGDGQDIIDILSSNIVKKYFEHGHVDRNLVENDCIKVFDGASPKNFFTVTEYNLMQSEENVNYNNEPKNILCDIFPPSTLKHLEIRPDGSLFINWAKSHS